MKTSFIAKLFGYLAVGVGVATQAGVHIGHVGNTDFLTLAAMLLGGFAVHAASNTSGDAPK